MITALDHISSEAARLMRGGGKGGCLFDMKNAIVYTLLNYDSGCLHGSGRLTYLGSEYVGRSACNGNVLY